MSRAPLTWAYPLALLLLARCHASGGRAQWADVGRRCLPWADATPLPAAARDSLPPLAAADTAHPDARAAGLARRLPGGWAGQYPEGGHPLIYLTAPERAAEVVARLRLPPDTRVRRVRWDYAQLYDWYRYLEPHTHGLAMVSLDVAEGRNRIEYGVLDDATRGQLEARLATLRVPCYLVAIEVVGAYPVISPGP